MVYKYIIYIHVVTTWATIIYVSNFYTTSTTITTYVLRFWDFFWLATE